MGVVGKSSIKTRKPFALNKLNCFLWILSGSLVSITILFRIPLFEFPFFGSHLFRQLQTVSTIEAFMRDGIHLLSPRTNYIGYPGFLLLECPIFQAFAAWVSGSIHQNPLVVTKTLNLIIGLLSSTWVFKISRRFLDHPASILAAFIYLVAPLNLMYHTSTLIDPSAVLTTLVAIHCFLKKTQKEDQTFGFTSVVFFLSSALTVLIKPLFLFPLALLMIADALSNLRFDQNLSSSIASLLKRRLNLWIPILLSATVLLAWLKISASLSEAQDVTSHLGWVVLSKPSFYLTILLRYCFYIQTPIVLFLSVFGVYWAFERKRNHQARSFYLICWTLPFTYYLAFANINRPHDYYSLILVPFVSLVAGAGIQKIRDSLKSKQNLHSQLWLFVTVCIVFLAGVFLYLSNYWISPSINNRYTEFSSNASESMVPFQYALVFVDRKGPFELSEYLAESRRNMILAKLGKLDEEEIRNRVLPIYDPAILYALNHQYGEVQWYSNTIDTTIIDSKIEEYQGNLHYIVVLMSSNPEQTKSTMANYQLVSEFENMIVYEVR